MSLPNRKRSADGEDIDEPIAKRINELQLSKTEVSTSEESLQLEAPVVNGYHVAAQPAMFPPSVPGHHLVMQPSPGQECLQSGMVDMNSPYYEINKLLFDAHIAREKRRELWSSDGTVAEMPRCNRELRC